MNRFLKILTVFLAIVIISTPLSVSAFYIDTPKNDQYDKAILHLAMLCPDTFSGGYFYPDKEVRRDEFLEIIFCEASPKDGEAYSNMEISFTDVDKEAGYVNPLKIALFWQAIKGFENNTFRPWAYMTNIEALKMLITLNQNVDRAFKGSYLSELVIPDNSENWIDEVVDYSIEKNLLNDLDKIKYHNITRKDLAQILYRFDVLNVTNKDSYDVSLDESVDYLTFFTNKERKENLENFKSLSQMVDSYYLYPDELGSPILYKEANKAVINSLSDPYTRSYSSEEFSYDRVSYDQVDLGFSIEYKEYNDYGYVYVSDIDRESMAYKKGLRKRHVVNNILLTPNGITEEGKAMDDYQMLFIDYQTSIHSNISRNFQVPIKIENKDSILAMILDDDIAYMRMHVFDDKALLDMQIYSQNLRKEENISGYVLDLRGNPGGKIDVLMKLSEYIFPRGTTIFKAVDKTGTIKDIKTKDERKSIWNKDVPWVVLVDGMSASASEVLTNALLDLKEDVTILGTPSYGKGRMQITFQDENTIYAITTGEMRSPDGRMVDNISIQPDIELNIGEMFMYSDKDRDLAVLKAVEILKGE